MQYDLICCFILLIISIYSKLNISFEYHAFHELKLFGYSSHCAFHLYLTHLLNIPSLSTFNTQLSHAHAHQCKVHACKTCRDECRMNYLNRSPLAIARGFRVCIASPRQCASRHKHARALTHIHRCANRGVQSNHPLRCSNAANAHTHSQPVRVHIFSPLPPCTRTRTSSSLGSRIFRARARAHV